jgi:HEAT repeat protein
MPAAATQPIPIPRVHRRTSNWKSIATSVFTCLAAVGVCLIVLRWLIVPVDTSKHNGRTAKEWIAALGSDDITVRAQARTSLEEMGDSAVSNLGYALRDSDVQIRRGAIQVLYGICEGRPATVDHLARALRDSDPWVRWQAAKALRRLGKQSKPAALALASALTSDPDARVRLVCVQALERIGDGAIMAHPALIMALSDEQYYVRQAAASAIQAVAPDKPLLP